MAEILFDSDQIQQAVPDGSRVMTVAEESGASLSFGCREASCGVCRVWVIEGMENFETVNEDEIFVLGKEKVKEGFRLGCQLVLKNGRVKIRNA